MPARKTAVLTLIGATLCLGGVGTAWAVLPLPVYPLCGSEADKDAQNCPNDFGEPWDRISYIKSAYTDLVRPEELELGSGVSLDKAFALETGDWRVTIAGVDSGIRWDEGNLRRKYRLNQAELPKPQKADGATSATYDVDGDGLLTVDDYAQDPRVPITAGEDVADGMLEPSDLIAVFSDGIDQDGNGYVDDISGWDFLWNDNNPFDDAESQGYSHGTGTLRRSGAEGGDGGSIGSCPSCSVMMLRVGDSFISESSAYAQAMLYGVDNGAKVLQVEIGAVNASDLAKDAVEYAWNHGVTVVASAADEASIHPNEPSALHHAVVVHPLTYSGTEEADSESYLVFNNCSNFGGRPTMTVSSDGCSSEATAIGSGLAGLLQSAAMHAGLSLTANEFYQLFIQNVDDVWVTEAYEQNKDWYPSKEGFDRYFGYGRVNIGRSVQAVVNWDIPPEADLLTPDWFEVVDPARTPILELKGFAAAERAASYHYVVEYGPGLDPTPDEFIPVTQSAQLTYPTNGVLARWDLTQIPKSVLDPTLTLVPFTPEDDPVTRVEKINAYTVTVRVRVIDSTGLEGEMRKTMYLRTDPDLLVGFPKYLGASLEPSPRLADLDLDGRPEIIQATSEGWIYAIKADGSTLSGWPVRTGKMRMLDSTLAGNHVLAQAYRSGEVSADRPQTLEGTPAVGDLDKDGRLEVVVGTWDGQVFAWRWNGQLMDGFPVSLNYSLTTQQTAGPNNLVDDGFFSGPALGDLNRDGYLDIVIPGMDQWIYAWDRAGKPIPGWPVQLKYPDRTKTATKGARIITQPAIGDINNDGMMDVVMSTGEIVDYVFGPTYAIHGDGNNHSGGPFLRGWPVLTIGLYANLLPTIGTGATSSPALADIDGDGKLEVATHTVAGYTTKRNGSIFRSDGSIFSKLDYKGGTFGESSNAEEPVAMPLMTSGAFADMDKDGSLDYTVGLAGGRYLGIMLWNNKIVDGTFATGAWDATTGELLPGFPAVIADIQFFSHQAVADVSGDGYPETISGNGAFTIHGFDYLGRQPVGWPKFTGQWTMATPALEDINGDGYLELVVGTRSGYLYAWKTKGKTAALGGSVEWPQYHHDLQGSGNYHWKGGVLAKSAKNSRTARH